MTGVPRGDGAGHPFKKGLLQTQRLHTCAKRIWSRSTPGLSFPLEKGNKKTQQ